MSHLLYKVLLQPLLQLKENWCKVNWVGPILCDQPLFASEDFNLVLAEGLLLMQSRLFESKLSSVEQIDRD